MKKYKSKIYRKGGVKPYWLKFAGWWAKTAASMLKTGEFSFFTGFRVFESKR